MFRSLLSSLCVVFYPSLSPLNFLIYLLTFYHSILPLPLQIMKDEMELVQDMESAEERDCDIYLDRLEHILELKSEAIFTLGRELKNFNNFR
jgi:hypothetical protein